MAELWRREPLGLLLHGFTVLTVCTVGYFITQEIDAYPWINIMAIVAFITTPIGMYRTHRAAFRLSQERRSQDCARTPAPWDK